jgi:FtsH-binding integral membrane protein
MTRTLISGILLGLAALGGVFLLTMRLRERPFPLWLVLGHGLLAATGLATLLSFVVDLVSIAGTEALLGLRPIGLGVLLVAALGGFVLLSFDVRRQPIPLRLMLLHGLVALSGYGCVLLGLLTGR